jgi:hypothetical protein
MGVSLSSNLPWQLANPKWASSLNPLLANPLNNASVLYDVSLGSGVNVIDHKLGHMMLGWFLIDPQGTATVYRSAPLNDLTLTLTASASLVTSIGVY